MQTVQQQIPMQTFGDYGYRHDESDENTAAENTPMGTQWQSPTPQFAPSQFGTPQFGPGLADLPPPPAYEPPPYE